MPSFDAVQDNQTLRVSDSFFRGEQPNWYPSEASLDQDDVVERYLVKGWMPAEPFIDKTTSIVAFGSCFASNISDYLHGRNYNVLTRRRSQAYVTSMGDGMVHTHAIRQQFEWAWLDRSPRAELWHGYKAEEFGYDEQARLDTKALFDEADVFIITFGLSEIWYDEPTGEVFWRAPPKGKFDASRHKFRVSDFAETLDNIRAIHALVRRFRPEAAIVFTVSPIPLTATFRPIACQTANAVSKAILRAAVDQHHRETKPTDQKLFYFPSFETVSQDFSHQWYADRRHVCLPVLDLNMQIFERYFCKGTITDRKILALFRRARRLDARMGRLGRTWDEAERDVIDAASAKRKADRIALRAAEAALRRKARHVKAKGPGTKAPA